MQIRCYILYPWYLIVSYCIPSNPWFLCLDPMIPFFPPKHVIIICSPLYLPFHSLPSRSMFDPSSIGFRRVVIDQVCQALCETLTLRESAGHRPWVRGWMVCFTSCASSQCVQCEAPKIAFSWFITPISLWFMVFYNYSYWGENQLITRGPHIVDYTLW